VNETRLAALRCAIDIWSVQQQDQWPVEPESLLHLAERLERWLTGPDRLTLTATTPRPIP
jgi:hypothetical protein